jgi:hypothetical protein
MSIRQHLPPLFRAMSVSIALLAAPQVRGDLPLLAPVAQSRSTSALVIVPPCGQPASVSDSDAATGFGPFDSLSTATRDCGAASASAAADQHSQIGVTLISASGSTDVDAAAASPAVIHSIAASICEVTFDVDEPGRFQLLAGLSASGSLPVISSFSRVTLRDGGGAALLDATLQAPPDGSTIIGDIWRTVLLAAGRYTLRVEAQSAIDSTIPPAGDGGASYGLTFESLVDGDIDGDGDADVNDLLALLRAWGGCPVCELFFCPADLNGDCDVDVGDLLALLANWTG